MDGNTEKPVVTTALVAVNTLIYFRPQFLHSIIPHIEEVLFNPHLIQKNNDVKRLYLSPFYHMNHYHFVDNMTSLLWKGIQLEKSMGNLEFASTLISLLTLSQNITIFLSESLLTLFGYKEFYYDDYFVGFSGLIFAMKVVLNSQSNEHTSIYGVPVPSHYAVWVELFLIHVFVPSSSFLVHLGGILAGLIYLRYVKPSNSGSNIWSLIFRDVRSLLDWPMKYVSNLFGFWRGWIDGGEIVGQTGRNAQPDIDWRCQYCSNENSDLLNVCEMCGSSGTSSLQRDHSNYYDYDDISINELRRRRTEMRRHREVGRFGRWCEDRMVRIIRQLG